MSAIIEEYATEYAKKVATEVMYAAVIRGFKCGVLTKENVKSIYPQLKKTEINKLYKQAQSKDKP